MPRLATTMFLGLALALGSRSTVFAAPPTPSFAGTAQTEERTHAVRFRFFCSDNNGPNVTGVLGVELWLADYASLRPVFDLDPFEGPDAHVGALSALHTSGPAGKGTGRFAAAGWIAAETPATTFVLGINTPRRGDARALKALADALRPLTAGPAELVWTQGNPRKGGSPIVARLTLDVGQATSVRNEIGRCLGR